MIEDKKLDELFLLAKDALQSRDIWYLWHENPSPDEGRASRLIYATDPETVMRLVEEIRMLRLERDEARNEIKRLMHGWMHPEKNYSDPEGDPGPTP
jgi:hypothetical protein